MSDVDTAALLHELAARLEIEKLVANLARAMDRNDREAILACYHPAAFDHHSEFDGPVEQFVDWIAALYRERLECMSHLLGNRVLELRGDTAYGETYVLAMVRTRQLQGQQADAIAAGRYLDRYERRDGQWRIAERTVVLDWQRTEAVIGGADAPSTVDVQIRGSTSMADVSYTHFAAASGTGAVPLSSYTIAKSAPALMAEARAITDIDLVDEQAEEPLRRMLESLNSEAQLSQIGALGMEQRLLRLLVNRLRMQRDFLRHPEIDQQQILKPVILAGGPRTGTTKLQNLLAASGDFQYLPFWRGNCLSLDSGDRLEDPAARIRRAEQDIRWFDEQSPDAKLTHPFNNFDADEESLILEHHLCSPFISFFAFVPSFMQWVASQDFDQQIQFVRQGLKYLQWQFNDGDPRPWILKCPIYGGYEPLLAQAYPGASFVINHRQPHATVSSTASLVHQYGKAYSDVDRRAVIGPMFLEASAQVAEAQMDVRDRRTDLDFLDVRYSELTRDAVAVAEQIYRHVGMSLSDRAREAMAAWDRSNRQHRHGTHRYTLEEFGLSERSVNSRYKAYIDRYSSYF